MKIVSGFLNEVVPQIFFSILNSLFFSFVFNLITHVFLLFFVKEGRNHTDRKHIVYQLKEAFFKDMSICEEEEYRPLAKQA